MCKCRKQLQEYAGDYVEYVEESGGNDKKKKVKECRWKGRKKRNRIIREKEVAGEA